MSEQLLPATEASENRFARFWRAVLISAPIAFGVFLVLLIVTGHTWRAIAYAVVLMFALLIGLAVYFWGTMIFGGLLEAFQRRDTPVPWTFEDNGGLAGAPEHDIDPGLELLAAGMLVYRMGEVKPTVHFRQVPLNNVRALRPFVVARTGEARDYQFRFGLDDERAATRFSAEFERKLSSQPSLVMPEMLLMPRMPRRLIGQRWRMRVTSGVTVVTTFGFMFVAGQERTNTPVTGQNGHGLDETSGIDQHDMLLMLLDDVLKQEAMTRLQEVVLEDL